jgi:hypothetical protein
MTPHNIWGETICFFQSMSQCQSHLCVIGELAWSPSKTTATNHLSNATEDRLWESLCVQAAWFEFKGCTNCVCNGSTHEDSACSNLLGMSEPGEPGKSGVICGHNAPFPCTVG